MPRSLESFEMKYEIAADRRDSSSRLFRRRQAWLFGALATVLGLTSVACSDEETPEVEEVRSALARNDAPHVLNDDGVRFAEDQASFALDLYHAVRKAPDHVDRDVFVSPHSISTALAMTYAGARGTTADGMRTALHFGLPDERLHVAFNALDLALSSRGQNVDAADPFRLSVVNSVWAQKGMAFQSTFLDTLAVDYGAGVKVLDFANATESARGTINGWVSNHTAGRIPTLLEQGTLDPSTRLMLVNAVYFKASWAQKFDESQTQPAPFTTLDGRPSTVSMMHQVVSTGYVETDDYQAVSLWYQGYEVQMFLLAPKPGKFAAVESSLTGESVLSAMGSLGEAKVTLSLPKFRLEDSFELRDPLTELGMGEAFEDAADFSGIAQEPLKIGSVIHKTFVSVDEHYTEAAAATSVGFVPTSDPGEPPAATMTIDRPFLAAIVDQRTKTLVFFGRILEPKT